MCSVCWGSWRCWRCWRRCAECYSVCWRLWRVDLFAGGVGGTGGVGGDACARLCMLEGGLCVLEALEKLEVMRSMLPYILEAVEGELCSLEVL